MTNILKYRNKQQKNNYQSSQVFHSQTPPPILEQQSVLTSYPTKKSLNKESRKRELLKITQENQTILKRLQLSQSRYNINKWVQEHKQKEHLLRNICTFPLVIEHNPKPLTASAQNDINPNEKLNFRSASMTQYSQFNNNPFAFTQSVRTSMQESQSKDKISLFLNTKRKNNSKHFQSDFTQRQAEQLDQNRTVFYKKGKYIKGGYFVIEISSNNQFLLIAAFDVESPQSFLISIPKPKADEIIELFNTNFETMADHLRIVNNKLVLLNPSYNKKREEQKGSTQSQELKNESSQNNLVENSQKQVQVSENKGQESDDKKLGIYNDDEEEETREDRNYQKVSSQ